MTGYTAIRALQGKLPTVPPLTKFTFWTKRMKSEVSLVIFVETAPDNVFFGGTFYIDPSIPSLDPSRNRRESCKGKKKSKNPVHASFLARHKPIFLNLGTTGNIVGSSKANVLVSNKSCDIHINLVRLPFVVVSPFHADFIPVIITSFTTANRLRSNLQKGYFIIF